MVQMPISQAFEVHTNMIDLLDDKVRKMEKELISLRKQKVIDDSKMKVLNTRVDGLY